MGGLCLARLVLRPRRGRTSPGWGSHPCICSRERVRGPCFLGICAEPQIPKFAVRRRVASFSPTLLFVSLLLFFFVPLYFFVRRPCFVLLWTLLTGGKKSAKSVQHKSLKIESIIEISYLGNFALFSPVPPPPLLTVLARLLSMGVWDLVLSASLRTGP